MAFSFKKNLAATGDYFRTQAKIQGLKGQIKAKQAQVARIRAGKAAVAAIGAGKGRVVHSTAAANRIAEKYR